jgi:hypothetical protein
MQVFGPSLGLVQTKANFNKSGFLRPLILYSKEKIHSYLHSFYAYDTAAKLGSSTDRCEAACALRTAQPFTVGLRMQVYWESPVGGSNVK